MQVQVLSFKSSAGKLWTFSPALRPPTRGKLNSAPHYCILHHWADLKKREKWSFTLFAMNLEFLAVRTGLKQGAKWILGETAMVRLQKQHGIAIYYAVI